MREHELSRLYRKIMVFKLFELCFLNHRFEESFLCLRLSGSKSESVHVTVTEWIFDENQQCHTRMKFYKMNIENNTDLTQVTETQNYEIDYHQKSNAKNNNNNNNNKISAIHVNSLVLPQTSLTMEPVFRIETNHVLFEMPTAPNVEIRIKIKVECLKKSRWGVQSMIERVLMKQAIQMYSEWLQFVHEEVLSYQQTEIEKIKEPSNDHTNLPIPVVVLNTDGGRNVKNRESKSVESDGGSIEIPNVIESNSTSLQPKDIINSKEKTNMDNTRGLNKPRVSCYVRFRRFCSRMCPCIHRLESKNKRADLWDDAVKVHIDSQCQRLESILCCVIMWCLLMIAILSAHKYLVG